MFLNTLGGILSILAYILIFGVSNIDDNHRSDTMVDEQNMSHQIMGYYFDSSGFNGETDDDNAGPLYCKCNSELPPHPVSQEICGYYTQFVCHQASYENDKSPPSSL